MASTTTPREIMSALIEGRKPTRRSKTIHTLIEDGREIIMSYGQHFVMGYRQGGDWYVTDAKYSATTSTHQRGVREALYDHGYQPTDETNAAGYTRWSR